MIFDTDVLIWYQRGNARAIEAVDRHEDRNLSVQSYLEIMRGARDKRQQKLIRSFLQELGFTMLPLTPNIGHRAAIYIEEHGLSSGIEPGDAIIAATAAENGLPLLTGNAKHFKVIKDLDLKIFQP